MSCELTQIICLIREIAIRSRIGPELSGHCEFMHFNPYGNFSLRISSIDDSIKI
ncbi:hypothetical protein XBKQ1_2350003 [Xenorhabdus bovienii str. kraussei Quebec]|uniref:Uncharacterized protein n=2 Tax=Xenorhabdus bovienii TaxID=40576 RepID=A0A077P5R8_XENBV|nr:hypothetical protein XBFM1_2320026 [Xenorhabdus bovienii str. feltiae Moldova]CDH19850.1 hypothetical protein XBKQ1_2350003 [Xenorhabdus bovienii str. kraussei Quebec]